MAFVYSDSLKEVLLKVMASMAWQGDVLLEDRKRIVEACISRLLIEGPERERIRNILDFPVDQFQKESLQNELKALLIFEEGRQQMAAIFNSLFSCDENSPGRFEHDFVQLVAGLMAERSRLSLMICRQSADAFNSSLAG